MTDPGTWLSMREAAKRAGCSPRTMRRRMTHLNRLSNGRLLRNAGESDVVRKWWINRTVLDELLSSERAGREGVKDLREEMEKVSGDSRDAHSRLDETVEILESHDRRLRKQGREIRKNTTRSKKNQRAADALKRAISALSEVSAAMLADDVG